jgi:beta-alanine--pyruvate transaminase
MFVTRNLYETFMRGPEHLIEFAHGYTYSGHPVACAAALGPSTPALTRDC